MNTENQINQHTKRRRRMRRTGRARCPQRAASNEKSNLLDAQYNPSPISPLKSETSESESSPNPVNPVNPVKKSSSSASSASSAVNSSPKRHRARPFQTLPEFAALTRDQLEYVHEIIRNKTLADAQQEIWSELHFRLHQSTLHRYKHKLLFAESLDLVDDATTAVDQLNDLLAARETSIPAAGQLVVQKRALAIAADPETSPSLLSSLHRIFTYEDRKQEKRLSEQRRHAHRLELAHLRENTRLQIHEERKTMNAHKRSLDLQKLKLARERLALDNRKQDHREKPADDVWTDEQQRQMSEQMEALIAGGRACLAQEREKEPEKQRACPIPPPPCGADIPVCASEPVNPNTPNQKATKENNADQ